MFMTFNWNHHAKAITLKSLNLGGYASLVPLITILIWNPTNSSKLSILNSYCLNSSSLLAGTETSGLPLFNLRSTIILSIPTSLLQGNFNQFAHSTGSVILNSTIGVFGILNPAEKIGLKPSKEDFGQTLGSYGLGSGCYFVLPILGPTTVRDSVGLLVDSYLDPFAHITIREKELFNISGNNVDYYSVKGTAAIDFRSDNITNFTSLEKNSIDLYSSFKSIYLQDRENKINNSISVDDDWGNLNN